jgi:hypothetical protein
VQNQQGVLNSGDNFELTVLVGSKPMGLGWVVEMIGPQLRARVSLSLVFGSAVKLECGGLLLLGDVFHCEPKDDGYIATILVRHMTAGLPGLQNLSNALREDEPGETPQTIEEAERTSSS